MLAFSALFAFYWIMKFRKKENKQLFIISIGLIVAIVLALFPFKPVQLAGIGIYFVFVALVFMYGLTSNQLQMKAKIVICLMSASIFIYWLWVLNHWHGNEVLLPFFVMLVGVAGLLTKAKLKDESGILIILSTDAVAIILEHWTK